MARSRYETPAVQRNMRRYYWTFGPAMVLYVVGAMLLFISEGRDTGVQLAMAAVPVLGIVWVAVALLGSYRRSDELMQLQMLRGAAAGFAFGIPALAISGLVYAFLDEPPGRPSLIAVWIPFMIGTAAWAIVWTRAQKRAR